MERRVEWEAGTGQTASSETVSDQACVMGAWTGAGAAGWGGVGRVRSEERPNDLFRLDHEAARHEVG